MHDIFLTQGQSLDYCSSVFRALGIKKESADIVADHLTQAELRGLYSHGIQRVINYTNKIKCGGYNKDAKIRILNETVSTARLDADFEMGAAAAKYAMEFCIKKAKSTGSATVSVTHGNHCGFLAYYTMMAAREDMVGFAMCNAGQSVIPWGAKQPLFGTNPFSVAIPANEMLDIVYDGASSVVANGKIDVARIEDKPIPVGWAVDADGNSTTDPHKAMRGYMLPFGQYKGSDIGMIISMLVSGFSHSPFDFEDIDERVKPETGTDVAFAFTVIDIAAFEDPDVFKERIDSYIKYVKSLKKAPGFDEVLLPGEKEFLCEAKMRKKGGYTIGDNLYNKLKAIRDELGLTIDMESWSRP